MPRNELDHAIGLDRELRDLAAGAADPAQARRLVHDAVVARNAKRVPDDIEVTAEDAGGVPGEWVVSPLDPEQRVVLFVHGGAFTGGSAAESRELTARLSRASQTSVLAVDVRLAPEHPLPAAVDDVVTAYRWLVAEGSDPREVGLVGESTGAAVALGAAIALRDAGEPGPGALGLLSPVVDLRPDALDGVDDPVGAREDLAAGIAAYLGATSRDDPAASPGLAELAGLPPTFIQAGTVDPALPGARALAERAEAAGVIVTFQEWEGMPHRWHVHPHIYDASRAVHQVGDFLLQRIGPGYVPVPERA